MKFSDVSASIQHPKWPSGAEVSKYKGGKRVDKRKNFE